MPNNDNDTIYYDTYNEGEDEEEKPTGIKKALKILFRAVFYTILASVMLILIFRFFSMKEPKRVQTYLFTQSVTDAYNNNARSKSPLSEKYPSERYTVTDLDLGAVTLTDNQSGEELRVSANEFDRADFAVYTQKLYNYSYTDPETGTTSIVKRDEYYADEVTTSESRYDGCYRVSNMYFTPKANNLQVTFRYSGRSGIAKLMHDYAMSEAPKGEVFVFTLSDDKGNIYSDYSYRADSRSYYQYRTLVFEGVDYDSVGELTLNIFYIGDVRADYSEPFVSMIIYDENLRLIEVEDKTIKNGRREDEISLKEAPRYSVK